MTQLSDAMVDLLENAYNGKVIEKVDRENGKIEFRCGYGSDFVLNFDPENAVEDIAEQAKNFNEDAYVLTWTTPRGNPDSLRHPLSDILHAADSYFFCLQDALYQLKDWRASGMTDKQISDSIENGGLLSGGRRRTFNIDMDNGEISFDHPILKHRDLGTGKKMTVDDVINVFQEEYTGHVIDDRFCDAIGVDGMRPGALPIASLIADSGIIHATLDCISNMLQEQRDIEQQEECR